MREFLVCVAILSMGTAPVDFGQEVADAEAEAMVQENQKREVDAYVDWFLQHYIKRARKAKEQYVPIIVEESSKYALDPLLLGVIVAFESSWIEKAEGSKFERGLFQIMPRSPARKKFDVSTTEGSIRAGVYWFGKCREMCKGDMLRALSAYQSGRCKPILDSARKRWEAYKNAIRRHGILERAVD